MTQRTRMAVTAATVTLSLAVAGAPLLATMPSGLSRQAALAPRVASEYYEDAGRWFARSLDALADGDRGGAEYCQYQAQRHVQVAQHLDFVYESVEMAHVRGVEFPGWWPDASTPLEEDHGAPSGGALRGALGGAPGADSAG